MRPLLVGDLCADLILPYGEVLKSLKTIKDGNFKKNDVIFKHGGTIGNTSSIMARLNDHPLFVTDLCADSIGIALKDALEEEGVDMSYANYGNHGTMVCIAVFDENGERIMFPWLPPGADYPSFTKDSFTSVKEDENYYLLSGGMVVTDNLASVNAFIDFYKEIKLKGDVTLFDINARIETYGLNKERKELFNHILSSTDIIIGSGIDEFGPLTSCDTLLDAIKSFGKDKVIIARDGANDVLLNDHGNISFIPTEKVKPISTLGAGDMFNGFFLHALIKGFDYQKAIQYANHYVAYMISNENPILLTNE